VDSFIANNYIRILLGNFTAYNLIIFLKALQHTDIAGYFFYINLRIADVMILYIERLLNCHIFQTPNLALCKSSRFRPHHWISSPTPVHGYGTPEGPRNDLLVDEIVKIKQEPPAQIISRNAVYCTH